jgi:hypothetical protein
MCIMGQLPLIICSERAEDVSLYPFRRIVSLKEGSQDNITSKTDWASKHEFRHRELAMTLHYYDKTEIHQNKRENTKKISYIY